MQILDWKIKTYILYGTLDNLQPIESISDFADRYECELTISQGSRHSFMEESDYEIVTKWIKDSIKSNETA